MHPERKAALVAKWINAQYDGVLVRPDGSIKAVFRDRDDEELFDFDQFELVAWRQIDQDFMKIYAWTSPSEGETREQHEADVAEQQTIARARVEAVSEALADMEEMKRKLNLGPLVGRPSLSVITGSLEPN